MSKLWICGICQNNSKDLGEILDPLESLLYDNQDHLGTIWVDGGSIDTTHFTLKSYGADVLERKWTNDHDFQMNTYMRAGLIKHGDWVLQLDTSERVHPAFIDKLLNGMLSNFEQQGINTVYQRSKPILFKYHDDQIYSGSPHWGIVGQRRHAVDISKFDGFEEDKNYLWSLRDDINKWITNGIKYYLLYGRSNHMYLIYSPSNYPNGPATLIQEHEAKRHDFRNWCRSTLSLSLGNDGLGDMETFDAYLKAGNFDAEFIQFLNYEKIIANYYRYVNGEDQQHIYDTQNEWKYVENVYNLDTIVT